MSIRTAPDQLEVLIAAVRDAGYSVVGPRVRDGAIVLEEIHEAGDLPRGYTDEQEKGRYRLRRTGRSSFFDFTAPAQMFRQFLQPAREQIFWARRPAPGEPLELRRDGPDVPKLALLGVKACDLAAIGVQDVVFGHRPNPRQPPEVPPVRDPLYHARRENLLIIATECGRAGNTCFCASMDTGPAIDSGYDLRITEFDDAEHWLLIDAGTARGRELLQQLDGEPAGAAEERARGSLLDGTRAAMGRRLETEGLPETLLASLDSPHWDRVAERCLACANCTLSCPTCFCTDTLDDTDVTGRDSTRVRHWDSCFNEEHSALHGGPVRKSIASRYRQWLVHKLSTWHDQFGSSGCVGCGRCISWCPVGIDITEEAAAIVAGRRDKT